MGVIAGISLWALAAQNANATTYTVDLTGPLGNSGGGYVDSFKTVYNDTNNTLAFSSSLSEKDGKLANGFWLVLNGGGSAGDPLNPKGHDNELAILYGDHNSGRLTAYIYNGQNNASSYSNPADFIQSFTTEFSSTYTNGAGLNDGISTFDFSINLNTINDPMGKPANWRGIQYDNEVGIWYHPFNGTLSYDNNGLITSFSTRYSGWFDTNRTYTTVPEPAGMGLMILGFAGLVFYRRERKTAR